MDITCQFIDAREYGDLLPGQTETKKGRYHGSSFPVDGFGVDRWVVGAKIVVDDYEHFVGLGYSDDQIMQGCIDYLNTPPPRKKYQRRIKKPLYGQLGIYRYYKKEKTEGVYFEVLFTTDQRKNKHFWSEGQTSLYVSAKMRRKRRKRKK